jgi:hypothetical protein
MASLLGCSLRENPRDVERCDALAIPWIGVALAEHAGVSRLIDCRRRPQPESSHDPCHLDRRSGANRRRRGACREAMKKL